MDDLTRDSFGVEGEGGDRGRARRPVGKELEGQQQRRRRSGGGQHVEHPAFQLGHPLVADADAGTGLRLTHRRVRSPTQPGWRWVSLDKSPSKGWSGPSGAGPPGAKPADSNRSEKPRRYLMLPSDTSTAPVDVEKEVERLSRLAKKLSGGSASGSPYRKSACSTRPPNSSWTTAPRKTSTAYKQNLRSAQRSVVRSARTTWTEPWRRVFVSPHTWQTRSRCVARAGRT